MGVYIQVDYTDVEGTAFKIEISDSTYSGVINQVQGKAVLNRPKVKTMDMLRGSSLNIQLEASSSDTWQDRLIETVGDKKLPVTFYRGGSVFWNGFIKPDGIVESFVTDYWVVNIQAIDGLGLLENIKFLDSSGEPYRDAYSELELLARCLELTGQSMQFRVYEMNMFFTVTQGVAPVTTNQALTNTYVNTDRYVKTDESNSVFTAKEVLESILKKYGAFITQQDNLWHIVRIIDYYNGDSGKYYDLYDPDGSLVTTAGFLMGTDLGSQIDSYDPHHAGGNQQKNYKAALGAYKVTYEYGLVKSILENPKMRFTDAVGTITGWTLSTTTADWTFVAEDTYYIGQMKPVADNNTRTEIIAYDYVTYDNDVLSSETLKINIQSYNNIRVPSAVPQVLYRQFMQIILKGDSGTDYYLNSSGEWTLSSAEIMLFSYRETHSGSGATYTYDTSTEIDTNGLPEDGTMTMLFYKPNHSASVLSSYTIIRDINISGIDLNIKGESYTARRLSNVTAVVDLEDKIKVGDNPTDLYIGAIEDSSQDNTLAWAKTTTYLGSTIDTSKQFPLLNWLARDRMTISGGNQLVFKGGVYGYLPYLGDLSINNVTGVFMTTSWKYDTAANRIEAEHERIFTDDIYSDVTVDFQLEADNIVKPAIE